MQVLNEMPLRPMSAHFKFLATECMIFRVNAQQARCICCHAFEVANLCGRFDSAKSGHVPLLEDCSVNLCGVSRLKQVCVVSTRAVPALCTSMRMYVYERACVHAHVCMPACPRVHSGVHGRGVKQKKDYYCSFWVLA
jgi:hypothetical protein